MSRLRFLINFILLLSFAVSSISSNSTDEYVTFEFCPCTPRSYKPHPHPQPHPHLDTHLYLHLNTNPNPNPPPPQPQIHHDYDNDLPCDHTYNAAIRRTDYACNIRMRYPLTRDDYHYTPGLGAHKFHTRALKWNDARKVCIEEGGHLAIINSHAEALVLLDIFHRSGPLKGSNNSEEAFLGIHDLYTEGDWTTVLDESLAKTGYSDWSDGWGGQPDNGNGRQNCGALVKEGKMDDIECYISLPFFCELSCPPNC